MAEKDFHSHIFNDEDTVLDLDINAEIHFSGNDYPQGKMIPIIVEGKEEYVLIPLDIKDGDTIKVSGRGKHNARTGKTGDMYVLVHIGEKAHSRNKLLICITALVFLIVAFMIGALIAHLSLTH